MSESEPTGDRIRAAKPTDNDDDAARKMAEDARTQALIRVSAEHARGQRGAGHFSQAELTGLIEAVERDLQLTRSSELRAGAANRRRTVGAPTP